MSDNLDITSPEDPTKINIHQDWELDYWSKTLGVSEEEIIIAVNTVGVMVANVKNHLGI